MYHVYALNSRYFQDISFPGFFSAGTFGVDIFFILSGYVMALISHKAIPGYLTLKTFVLKRAFRIFPIYWMYTFLVLLVYVFYPEGVNSSYEENPSIIKSLLLIPDVTNPWLNVGWTLIYEIYFYFIISILLFFQIRVRNILLTILFIFLILYNFFFFANNDSANPFEKYYLSPLICEFILGYWLFYKSLKFSSMLSTTIIILSFLFVITSGYWIEINSNFKRLFLFGLPAALFVYSFLSLCEGKKNYRSIVLLGDISFSTYLSHVLVINSVGMIFKILGIDGVFGSILCLVVSILAVYIWSYISYTMVEKRVMLFVKK